MMKPIILQAPLFREHGDSATEHERSRLSMLYFLEALVAHDRLWLRTYPDAPDIYSSGVRYVYKDSIEAPAWQDITTCLSKGYGDCKDFACWRVAELRERYGVDCHPVIVWRKVGGAYRFHALVEFPDGTQEDPSAMLGMGEHKPFKFQVTPPVSKLGGIANMDASKMAKAIVAGLISKEQATRARAKMSYRKVASLAGDDSECAKAVAMVKRGCAMLRKKIVTDNDSTTLGAMVRSIAAPAPKKGIFSSIGALAKSAVKIPARHQSAYASVAHAPKSAAVSGSTAAKVASLKSLTTNTKGRLASTKVKARKILKGSGVTIGDNSIASFYHSTDAIGPLNQLRDAFTSADSRMTDLFNKMGDLIQAQQKLALLQSNGNPAAAPLANMITNVVIPSTQSQIDDLNALLDQTDQQLADLQAQRDAYAARQSQDFSHIDATIPPPMAPPPAPSASPYATAANMPPVTSSGTPSFIPATSPDSGYSGYSGRSGGGGGGGGSFDDIPSQDEPLDSEYGPDDFYPDDSIPDDNSDLTGFDDDDGEYLGDDFSNLARGTGEVISNPQTGGIFSALFSAVPIVGPLLAPLSSVAIKEAGDQLQRANGGDPKAMGEIKTVAAQAAQGNPRAEKKLDALKRVHAANKAVGDSLVGEPFPWSFSNVYHAAVEGIHAVKH